MAQQIPVQPMAGGEPLMCLVNVQKRISAMGGKAVFGWGVRHDCFCTLKYSHCVWEDDQGQLWDVTPIFVSGGQGPWACIEWPEYTEFERDDAASFTGDSLLTRYVPNSTDPHLARACKYMERADVFLKAGDLDKCRYWTGRANTELRRAGINGGWDTPSSLDLNDVITTMQPQAKRQGAVASSLHTNGGL
jgi:hypothetical protein